MKLFDIVAGKCVVHADFLAIPPIRRYWESTKDKQHVNNHEKLFFTSIASSLCGMLPKGKTSE